MDEDDWNTDDWTADKWEQFIEDYGHIGLGYENEPEYEDENDIPLMDKLGWY